LNNYDDSKSKETRQMLESLYTQNKTIVFLNGVDESNYPKKLFSRIYNNKITYYYSDFFLSRYFYFEIHNKKYFGEYNHRLNKKIEIMYNDDNCVIISRDKYNDFIKEYLFTFHNIIVEFEPLDNYYSDREIRPYLIKKYQHKEK
jgi:hypothetical protein